MIKIGYQGIVGSNTYKVIDLFLKENQKEKVELIPLISSENVVKNLISKKIDIGVCAISNNTGGEVMETKNAIKNIDIKIIKEIIMPIHHCIYVKNKKVAFKDIKKIASHEQALKQVKNYIKNKFDSNIILLEEEDTAICADKLKNGELDKNTAVIINKETGESRGMFLLEENIEDNKNNSTKFIIFKLNNL